MKQRDADRRKRKSEWNKIDKMGIAKWKLHNFSKIDEVSKSPSISPTNDVDDMECAYAHVKYQKSFDLEQEKLNQEKYSQMKQSRQVMLKPIKSLGIKKFSRQYESIKSELTQKRQMERMMTEQHEKYKPPGFTNIAKNCFKEELLSKEQEEKKKHERMKSNKLRDKYWVLVRDLHAPKISEIKKNEMQNLVSQVENKRLYKNDRRQKNNSSTKNENQSQTQQRGYFSSGMNKHNKGGKSTDIIMASDGVKKRYIAKRKIKKISENRYQEEAQKK